MDIADKVVVITGGSRGLGRSLAVAFKAVGALVVITARQGEELGRVAHEVGAVAIACDVRQEREVKELAEKVVAQFGRIDIWVNNAGVWLPHAPIEETNWDRVHDMFEVNVFGTMYGTKYALTYLRAHNSGAIVNILSKSALEVRAGSSSYGASKCAAMGFTRGLMREVEGSGIQAFAVYPGSMQTNLFDEQKPGKYAEYLQADFVAHKIVQNLTQPNPEAELVVKRPGE